MQSNIEVSIALYCIPLNSWVAQTSVRLSVEMNPPSVWTVAQSWSLSSDSREERKNGV